MSDSKENLLIWINGELIPWKEATVHVMAYTLHYGFGIFEGVRAYATDQGPAIFRLQDHTDRFFRSAHIMNIPMPFDKTTLNKAQLEIINKNKLGSAYLRPMAYYDVGTGLHTSNLKTNIMIASWEWGTYLGGKEIMEKGIKVQTASYTRNHPNSVYCKAKANGNYTNSILALQEAQRAGCDEALLLDHEGYVAEGSGENIFIVRKDKIFTPHTSSALEGITRETIMTIAEDMGYEVSEKPISRDEVYVADEAFFTGTAAEVTPIRKLDGRKIGSGKRGPVTEKLQSKYFDIVNGRAPEYAHWLTYVANEVTKA